MVPAGLLLLAAAADAGASQTLAFYALLAAVPAVAVASLSAFGELIEREQPFADDTMTLQALLWTGALGLIVLAASSRASVIFDGSVTRLADSALLACIGILALEGFVAVVAQLRQPAPSRI